MRRSLVPLLAASIVISACGSLPAPDAADGPSNLVREEAAGASDQLADEQQTGPIGRKPRPASVTSQLPPSDFAPLVTPLPSALGLPEASDAAVPTSITFDAIGLAAGDVVPVGVEANGEMEIPDARRIGWYRFGPSPGEAGSAVLAAHIAFDGERGAFRFLADTKPGDRFSLEFDDGSTTTYEVTERTQYDKDELPFETVFAQSGPPLLTLISCGGSFQPSLGSYEDNIVAYAIAIG